MLFHRTILVGSLIVAANAFGDTGDPMKVKPVQTIAGGDSRVHAPLVRLIEDQAKWTELWNIHKGALAVVSEKGDITYPDAPKPPTVDFSKNQVLVAFGGKLPNVQKYDYVKTYANEDTAVVQLAQDFLPTGSNEKTFYPFIMLVVPKEPVKIEVQLDSIAKDGSHFWLKIASYGIPKAVKQHLWGARDSSRLWALGFSPANSNQRQRRDIYQPGPTAQGLGSGPKFEGQRPDLDDSRSFFRAEAWGPSAA